MVHGGSAKVIFKHHLDIQSGCGKCELTIIYQCPNLFSPSSTFNSWRMSAKLYMNRVAITFSIECVMQLWEWNSCTGCFDRKLN